MLNKRPDINKAIRTLDSILRRMQDHQDKSAASCAACDRGTVNDH